MMSRLVWCVILALVAGPAAAQLPTAPDKVAEYLQTVSVTLKSSTAQGSGTLIVVPIDGKPVTFCWTAAHVVNSLRQVKEIVAPDGSTKKVVTFADAQVVQELIEDGRRVGEVKMDARIVVFSEKEDLCLLRVRKKGFAVASAVFYEGAEIPKVGSGIFHCGSPGGQEVGAASVTSGIVSQVGRTFSEYTGEFDQVDCAAMPGSSGGAVHLKDGRYIGMITLGIRGGDSFHYMVPIRRVRAWADKMKVDWALGAGKPPTTAELDALPVEDTGTLLRTDPKTPPAGLKYMIRPLLDRLPADLLDAMPKPVG